MSAKIVIIDYGMGNLNSVKRIMDRLRVESVVSSEAKTIREAQKIILPGVGHFGRAMDNLRQLNLLEPLNEAVLTEKKTVLGICLGMQLFARRSAEGGGEGLGWIDAEVLKFETADNLKFKVPHMGWNQAKLVKDNDLMKGVSATAEFYFVHSYYMNVENHSEVLTETEFDRTFSSAVAKENIFGVQFHPEKSHDAGARLLKNFAEL